MRFWACAVSITVHLVALTALGFVKFSGVEAGTERRAVPAATVNRIKRLVDASVKIPKPKVREPAEKRFIEKSYSLSPTSQIFDSVNPATKNWPDLVKPSASVDGISLPGSTNLREGIEFFGSFTDERKVCYVVDCSGSMQGVFGQVRKKLRESIGNLQQDQYFYIIFFGGNRLFEFGDGRLIRATEESKSAANKFIDSVQPAGRTNALAAFERAVQIRDSTGKSSAVIYFLTDGFELTNESERGFSQRVAGLLARFAPGTKISTIGFRPQSDDREMLRIIARQSGGECVLVDDY